MRSSLPVIASLVLLVTACTYVPPTPAELDESSTSSSTSSSSTSSSSTSSSTSSSSTSSSSTSSSSTSSSSGSLDAPWVLDGSQWLSACTPGTNGDPNPRACHCVDGPVSHDVQIGGEATQRWMVSVRILGVMERMTYVDGTADGAWYIGGKPGDSSNNYYKLSISSPASTYFINHGSTNENNSTAHDYTVSFEIDGGATVTFASSGQDGIQWEGVDVNDAPIVLKNVVDPPQPYNGQFAVLSVLSVTPL